MAISKLTLYSFGTVLNTSSMLKDSLSTIDKIANTLLSSKNNSPPLFMNSSLYNSVSIDSPVCRNSSIDLNSPF